MGLKTRNLYAEVVRNSIFAAVGPPRREWRPRSTAVGDACLNQLQKWLAQGPLITDGGWGTELQRRGLPPGAHPDTWNLSHPAEVEEVARSWVEAGSEVILTNTFRANALALPETQLDALNRAGVSISRRAAARRLVFASMGPTGRRLRSAMPNSERLVSGNISHDQAAAAFTAQAQSLAAAGPDALLLETMSDIDEARLAVEAGRRTGLPVIVSFTFQSGSNQDRTMTGASPEDVAIAMVTAGASAVGANCGVGVQQAVSLCQRFRAACDLPIWIKPNAGLPIVEGSTLRYSTSAEAFAAHCAPLRDAGAAFIGGCCGSTPDFIRALVKARYAAS